MFLQARDGVGAAAVFAIIAVVLMGGIGVALFAMSSHSSLAFDPAPVAIGLATPLNVRIVNPHGVRSVSARIEMGGNSTTLYQVTRPATRFSFWRAKVAPETVQFIAGKDPAPWLKEG